MNRYSVTTAAALISVLSAIGTGMYVLNTRPSDSETAPRPTLQQLEVVEPEDTPYTKEELEEIFR